MIPRRSSKDLAFRVSLGFEGVVRTEFAFLETEHNMHVVESQPTLVRYESATIFVNIYHGRSSYELVFEVGRNDRSEDRQTPFLPCDFIGLTDPEAAKTHRYFAATSPGEVERGLRQLASMFLINAEEVLKNPVLFDQLAGRRAKAIREFFDDMHERQTRPKAEDAFRRRDYKAAAALYGSMERRLTPTERRKLEMARKRGK